MTKGGVSHMSVEYRDVVGYPGYRVGTDGSVWSLHRSGRGGMTGEWRRMKPGDVRGYLQVRFWKDGRRGDHEFVHHLVLGLFVGPCPEGMECRHLNGVPTDNRLENLAWGTRSENAEDRRKHGRVKLKFREEDLVRIKDMYRQGYTQTEIAKIYGSPQPYISNIIRGKVRKGQG